MDDFHDPASRPDRAFTHAEEIPSSVIPRDTLTLGHWAYHSMWLHPRQTIRRIVDVDPQYHANLLIALAGIAESLDRASTRNMGDKVPFAVVLGSALIIGPGMALIGAWIYSHLIRIAGNWMGGRGVYYEIKAAVAWSSLPTVLALVLWIPLVMLVGKEMFTEEMPSLTGNISLSITLVGLSIGQLVLGLWAFVLLCNSIAEVQEYRSAWKGLWNMIVAGAIVFVPLFLVFSLILFAAGGIGSP